MTVVHSPAPVVRRADNYITSRSFEQQGEYSIFFSFSYWLIPFFFLQFQSMMVAQSKGGVNLLSAMQIFRTSVPGPCMNKAIKISLTMPLYLLVIRSIPSERALVADQMVYLPISIL